jgi:ryanodine receptor 2
VDYTPKPIDTSGVTLTPEILALVERLAENAHDVWSALRYEQGWSYGPVRDNDAKKNPLLVPYAELPESEKRADRDMVRQTLMAMLALGYTISRQ